MSETSGQAVTTNVSSIKGINHVGLSVRDLNAAVAFYTNAIGVTEEAGKQLSNLTAQKSAGFSNEPIDRATLKGPNAYLELSQYAGAASSTDDVLPVKGPGVTHFCYQAPVAEDIYGRLKAEGATAVSRGNEPISLLGQGVYYAYGRDCDGIMFETEHLDRSPFAGPIWLSHIALVSPDLDRLVAFYENLLGVAPNRRTNKAAGPTFDAVADYDNVHIRAAWFDLGNMILELWQFVNPVTPEPESVVPIEKIGYNKVAFEVLDIDRDYARLVDAGVHFLSAPVSTPESTEVYGRDPDGNLFSLIQPATGSSISIDELKKKDW